MIEEQDLVGLGVPVFGKAFNRLHAKGSLQGRHRQNITDSIENMTNCFKQKIISGCFM